MKNRNYFKAFLVLVAVAILGLTSCKPDDNTPPPQLDPSITLDGGQGFISQDATVSPGETVRIKGVASKGPDGAKLQTFEWKVTDGRTGGVGIRTIDIKGEVSYTFDTTFNVGTQPGQITVEMKVTDKDGRSASRSITITIQQPQQATPPKSKTGVVLTYDTQNGAYANSFFSSANMTLYTEQQAQANPSAVDIAYFYSSTSLHNLVSPTALTDQNIFGNFAISWGANAVSTVFRKHASVTADSITRITDETVLQQLFNDATNVQANCGVGNTCDGTRVNNSIDQNTIAPNSVILFKGANGKYGAIVIKNMVAGALTIDVYAQN